MPKEKQPEEMASPPQTPTPSDSSAIADLTKLVGKLLERDDKLHEQMLGMFQRSLDTNALDKVLVKGFNDVSQNIAAQTGPLRSLGREYPKLPDDAAKRLDALAVALTRQEFSQLEDQGAIRPLPKPRSYAS